MASSNAPESATAGLLSLKFDNTLGALFIGAQLSALLLGITSVQVYMYYTSNSNRDSRAFKALIAFLWFLDALHGALYSESFYHYGVSNFLDPLPLLSPTWGLISDVLAGDLSNVIVSMIFLRRIWLLSDRGLVVKAAVAAILLLTVVITTGVIGIMVTALHHTFSEFNAHYKWIWYITFCSRAAVDITIVVALCLILWKSHTTFSKTNSLVRILMLYTINTGALTASVAIAIVITYAALPDTYVSFAVTVLLPKLMFNSLLGMLNSRQALRERATNVPQSIHLSRMPFTTQEDESVNKAIIHVHQEVVHSTKEQSVTEMSSLSV